MFQSWRRRDQRRANSPDLREGAIATEHRQRAVEISEVLLLRHEDQVPHREVGCEEGIAAGSVALRGGANQDRPSSENRARQ